MNCDATSGLSADDIRALKLATSVCFDHDEYGTGQIRAYRENRGQAQVFSETGRGERVIRVSSRMDKGQHTGYVHIGASQFSEHWQTVAHLLQAGDRVTLVWRPDWHSNALCRHAMGDGLPDRHDNRPVDFAGLHADELSIQIDRPTTRGGRPTFRRYTFMLDVEVNTNNSARMVRPFAYRIAN